MKKLVIFAAAAAALVAVPTIAQVNRDADTGIARAEIADRVRQGFLRIDRDRDGFVTQAEADSFRTTVRAERSQQRMERKQAHFARLDRNRDGAISRDEFFAPADPRSGADRAERRRHRAEWRQQRAQRGLHFGPRAFERMDSNRDGRISLAEATEQSLRRFDRVDVNRDGRITPDERRSFRADRRRDRI
jgi:Ca2+-binding EF-hand superfamily protein